MTLTFCALRFRLRFRNAASNAHFPQLSCGHYQRTLTIDAFIFHLLFSLSEISSEFASLELMFFQLDMALLGNHSLALQCLLAGRFYVCTRSWIAIL